MKSVRINAIINCKSCGEPLGSLHKISNIVGMVHYDCREATKLGREEITILRGIKEILSNTYKERGYKYENPSILIERLENIFGQYQAPEEK